MLARFFSSFLLGVRIVSAWFERCVVSDFFPPSAAAAPPSLKREEEDWWREGKRVEIDQGNTRRVHGSSRFTPWPCGMVMG